jgi:hypothetical protein
VWLFEVGDELNVRMIGGEAVAGFGRWLGGLLGTSPRASANHGVLGWIMSWAPATSIQDPDEVSERFLSSFRSAFVSFEYSRVRVGFYLVNSSLARFHHSSTVIRAIDIEPEVEVKRPPRQEAVVKEKFFDGRKPNHFCGNRGWRRR